MQVIRADFYRGKKMRLSAFVKSEKVEQAGLWFHIDGENIQVLGFDGMENKEPVFCVVVIWCLCACMHSEEKQQKKP